jgi:hypothetical protein
MKGIIATPFHSPLFVQVIETTTTRDAVLEGEVRIVPPPGRGWRVLDAHRERYTKWMRRRPVMRVWKRQRK